MNLLICDGHRKQINDRITVNVMKISDTVVGYL